MTDNIRLLQKTLVPHTSKWISVPISIWQDLDAKKIIKVEVLGDVGQLLLYPVEGKPGVVRTPPESREETQIDFNNKVYSYAGGVSTFSLTAPE